MKKKKKIIISLIVCFSLIIGLITFSNIKQSKADGMDQNARGFIIPFFFVLPGSGGNSSNGKGINLSNLLNGSNGLRSLFNSLKGSNGKIDLSKIFGGNSNSTDGIDIDDGAGISNDIKNNNTNNNNNKDKNNKNNNNNNNSSTITTKGGLSKADAKKLGMSDNDLNLITECLKIVNENRAKQNLGALSTNLELTKCANIRSKEIAQVFDHTRPNGKSCFSVLSENNVSYMACGENIAAGHTSAKQVMDGWMNSSGHRANIMNGSYKKVGIGVYKASNGFGYQWTQIFTN